MPFRGISKPPLSLVFHQRSHSQQSKINANHMKNQQTAARQERTPKLLMNSEQEHHVYSNLKCVGKPIGSCRRDNTRKNPQDREPQSVMPRTGFSSLHISTCPGFFIWRYGEHLRIQGQDKLVEGNVTRLESGQEETPRLPSSISIRSVLLLVHSIRLPFLPSKLF